MPNVTIVPTNSAQVRSRLKKISRGISDMSIPHKKISVMLDRWVQINFKEEGDKVGKWPKLKAGGRYKKKTGKAKRKLDTSAKILQDTGRLRKSFLPFFNKKDAGVGSDLPYSEPHEKGLGNLPKRRMLPILKDVKRDIVKEYENHIRRASK